MTNVNIVEPFQVQEIMQRSKNDELVAFHLDSPPFSTPIISFSKKSDSEMTDSQVTKFHLAN